MDPIPPQCIERHEGRELICRDRGTSRRRMVFVKNPSRIAEKIRIDDCVITEGRRCDYLVRDWKDRHHFVELKGKKVLDAFDQIEGTVAHILPKDGTPRPQAWGFIITSRVAPAEQTVIQVRKAKLKKRWNLDTAVHNNEWTHELTDD